MFGFLKKKKPEEPIKFESFEADVSSFDPWDASQGNTDNDFANVNFLNSLQKPTAFPESADAFPRYISYDLDIHDPIKKFKEMLAAGYLEVASAADILATYKQAELKAVLVEHDLPTTGRKNSDLLERILSSLNVDELNLPAKYVVSAKGQQFIERNQDLVKLFHDAKRYKVTYEEFAAKKAETPYLGYNDIIWSLFVHREMAFTSDLEREFNAECRAIFLEEEGRLVDALKEYIRVLYFKVNYTAHCDLMISRSSKEKKKYEACEYFPDTRLHGKIYELQEHYLDIMVDKCLGCTIDYREPIKLEDFRRLVRDIFDGIAIELKNYY